MHPIVMLFGWCFFYIPMWKRFLIPHYVFVTQKTECYTELYPLTFGLKWTLC